MLFDLRPRLRLSRHISSDSIHGSRGGCHLVSRSSNGMGKQRSGGDIRHRRSGPSRHLGSRRREGLCMPGPQRRRQYRHISQPQRHLCLLTLALPSQRYSRFILVCPGIPAQSQRWFGYRAIAGHAGTQFSPPSGYAPRRVALAVASGTIAVVAHQALVCPPRSTPCRANP